MKKMISFLIFLTFLCCAFGTVNADDDYKITVSAADQYVDTQETWYADIQTPMIAGMKDTAEQTKLNDAFKADSEKIIAQYKTETAKAEKDFPGEDKPHFGYQYSYEVVTDDDDIFSFRTIHYFAAGSSSTETKYYTFDKEEGKQMNYESLFAGSDYLAVLTDYIRGQMEEANKNDGMYWLEDSSLEDAMAQISEKGHWYINDKDRLVIVFDKYEVAPGAAGRSEFVIPNDVMEKIESD